MNEVQPGRASCSWDSLEDLNCLDIFKFLSPSDRWLFSTVSKQWNKLLHCDKLNKELLFKTYAAAIKLLQNHITLQNSNYNLPRPNTYESIYAFINRNMRVFNDGKGFLPILKEMINSCELNQEKVHIWKALPPHDFSLITSILLKQNRSSPMESVSNFRRYPFLLSKRN